MAKTPCSSGSRAGIYTALTTQEILDSYLVRWSIEVFFRQAKQNLALDQYQIRSALGIRRFWVLMSTAHLFSCIGTGQTLPFHEGFAVMQKAITTERISFIFHCALSRAPLDHVLAVAAQFCAFLQFFSIIVYKIMEPFRKILGAAPCLVPVFAAAGCECGFSLCFKHARGGNTAFGDRFYLDFT